MRWMTMDEVARVVVEGLTSVSVPRNVLVLLQGLRLITCEPYTCMGMRVTGREGDAVGGGDVDDEQFIRCDGDDRHNHGITGASSAGLQQIKKVSCGRCVVTCMTYSIA